MNIEPRAATDIEIQRVRAKFAAVWAAQERLLRTIEKNHRKNKYGECVTCWFKVWPCKTLRDARAGFYTDEDRARIYGGAI